MASRQRAETGWPFVTLTCRNAGIEQVEEWLLLNLPHDAGGEGYRGLRIEPGSAGLLRVILSFSTVEARDRGHRQLLGALQSGPSLPPGDLRMGELGLEPPINWLSRVAATVHAIPLGERYAALPGKVSQLAGRQGIRVDRGCAFGTGEHPSTKLAAGFLEQWVQPGEAVLDLGTGTGLLAALAVLQGGTPVVGLDLDREAIRVAEATRRKNGVWYEVICGSLDCLAGGSIFRVVVANIERDVLLGLMPDLARVTAPGGHLILSGLLREQVEDITEAGGRYGLVWRGTRTEGEWGAVHLCARPAARPRVICTNTPSAGSVALSATDAHHLLRVRRIKHGDPVEVLDGEGHAWAGRLTAAGDGAQVRDLEQMTMATDARLAVELWQAVPHQAGRFEAIVRGATELGVRRIVPIITERCQGGRFMERRSLERFRRVAREATRQCGRNSVPELPAMCTLRQMLDEYGDPETEITTSLVVDPGGCRLEKLTIRDRAGTIRLLVGPEGGFTGAEIERALRHHFQVCRLGPRILRTETAAVAAVALVMARWGDLGGFCTPA